MPPSSHGSVSERTASRVRRPMAYDLVIFDCDGVLVDSEPLSNRILAERLTAIGLPTTTEESIRDFMGRSWATCQRDDRAAARAPAARRTSRTATTRSSTRRCGASCEPVAGDRRRRSTRSTAPCVRGLERRATRRSARALGATGLLERFEGADLQRHRRRARQAGAGPVPARRARVRRRARRAAWSSRTRRAGAEAGRRAGMDVLGYAGLTAPELLAAEGATRVPLDGRAAGAAQRFRSQMSRRPVSVSRSSTSSISSQ